MGMAMFLGFLRCGRLPGLHAVLLLGAIPALLLASPAAGRPPGDLSKVYLWIDGNPIPPNESGERYIVAVAADSVDSMVTVNGYVYMRRERGYVEKYSQIPRESPLHFRVYTVMDSLMRLKKSVEEIADSGAAILRRDPAIKEVEIDQRDHSLIVRRKDGGVLGLGRPEYWLMPVPGWRGAPSPLTREAKSLREDLSLGTTVVSIDNGQARHLVSPRTRMAMLREIDRARHEFSKETWHSRELEPWFAEAIRNPAPVTRYPKER